LTVDGIRSTRTQWIVATSDDRRASSVGFTELLYCAVA
jgi:hypothetical protein